MQSRDRPPAGIAASELFERWLPDAFTTSGHKAPAGAPVILRGISGAGGGAWELLADSGQLVVRAPADVPPDIWVRLSLADLRVVMGEPDPDLPELLPAGWGPQDALFVDPADVDLVRQISGRLLFEIQGKRRRRWSLDVGFGPAGVSAGRPRTTLRLDGVTLTGLRDGSIAPMQLLLDGRLKVEGDRALAMQLLLLVGSRLARR